MYITEPSTVSSSDRGTARFIRDTEQSSARAK